MDTVHNLAKRNTNECCERVCQKSKSAKRILDADCCHEGDAFSLLSLPRKLPGLFTVRFTAPADFTAGDVLTLKGREFAFKTRTMEEPEGKMFSAGAVVLCDIDMERDLAFITPGGEAQGGVILGTTDPLPDGEASAGISTNVSREDHVHPRGSITPDYGKRTVLLSPQTDPEYFPTFTGGKIGPDADIYTMQKSGWIWLTGALSLTATTAQSPSVNIRFNGVTAYQINPNLLSAASGLRGFSSSPARVEKGDKIQIWLGAPPANATSITWWETTSVYFFPERTI